MKIISKKILADVLNTPVVRLEVLAPDISQKALPGQFVVLMTCEKGERIPLTIAERDTHKNTITLIFQVVGLTTQLLARLNVGESLYSLVGPLGHPTEIRNFGKVILVGGGVGIAEIFPVARALKTAGNHITTILGSRSRDLLILEEELKNSSDAFFVITDDGSYGRKGFTTDILAELLDKDRYDLVYAVGPIPMMRKVSSMASKFKVLTIVSLNAVMVDGTGMCGCCRVTVGGEVKFSCVDGPEFDGSQVDWDEFIKRNKIYTQQEKHICNLLMK